MVVCKVDIFFSHRRCNTVNIYLCLVCGMCNVWQSPSVDRNWLYCVIFYLHVGGQWLVGIHRLRHGSATQDWPPSHLRICIDNMLMWLRVATLDPATPALVPLLTGGGVVVRAGHEGSRERS